MCFNQKGDISTLDGTSLKLVDKFTYQHKKVIHQTDPGKPYLTFMCFNQKGDISTLDGTSLKLVDKFTYQHKKVIHQTDSGKPYLEPNITIQGQRLKVIDKFTNLCSTHSKSIVMADDVNTRLAKVSVAFGRLNRNIWNRRGMSGATKIKIYCAVVLTILIYGFETCTTYQRHIKKLNHFHTTCLRKILGITWQKHIPYTKVLTRASLPSINTILMESQRR